MVAKNPHRIDASIEALKAALIKCKDTPGMTPKDIADAGGVPSFATVYRWMKPGASASMRTVLAIERGYVSVKAAKNAS